MLKDIPVNKFFPWSIRNPYTSLSLTGEQTFSPQNYNVVTVAPSQPALQRTQTTVHTSGVSLNQLWHQKQNQTQRAVPWPQSQSMVYSEAGVLLTIIMGAGGASPPHLRLVYGLQRRLEHALYSLHLLPIRMLLQMYRHVLSGNRVNQPVHQPLKVGTLNCQNQSPKCLFLHEFYSTCSFDLRLHTIIKSTKSVLTQMI